MRPGEQSSTCSPAGRRLQMADCLIEKRPDGVALITLNRPESLNAMGGDLLRLLAEYIRDCETDRSVRCLALTGAGRGFCAGGDVKGMVPGDEAPQDAGVRRNVAAALEQA